MLEVLVFITLSCVLNPGLLTCRSERKDWIFKFLILNDSTCLFYFKVNFLLDLVRKNGRG